MRRRPEKFATPVRQKEKCVCKCVGGYDEDAAVVSSVVGVVVGCDLLEEPVEGACGGTKT